MNTFLNSDKSIYLQISEIIETDILRGILLEDEKVPSTNELTKAVYHQPGNRCQGNQPFSCGRNPLQKKGHRDVRFPRRQGADS